MGNQKVNILLVVFVVILSYLTCENKEVVKTETKTEIKYDTITQILYETKPARIEKVYIRVSDTVKDIKVDTILVDSVIFMDKKVNKYTYIDTLKNGRLKSVILADTIYKRDITLDVYNKETITEITKTIQSSNFFLGTEFDFMGGNNKIYNTSLKGYYQRKDKWLFSLGIGYDNLRGNVNYSLGIAIKF